MESTYIIDIPYPKEIGLYRGQLYVRRLILDSGIEYQKFKWNHGIGYGNETSHVYHVTCDEETLTLLILKTGAMGVRMVDD